MHPESQHDPSVPSVSPGALGRSAPADSAAQGASLAALVAAAADEPSTGSSAARDELRHAVFALVAALKADGQPPERVLVAVKSAAEFDSPGGGSLARRGDVRGTVVRWCVEAYYATS